MDNDRQVGVAVAPARARPDGERGGVSFPLLDGRRSTSVTGRAILADAAAAVDSGLAQRILACGDWRHEYAPFIRELTASCAGRPEPALAIARAGLRAMRSRLTFARGGREIPVEDALAEVEPAGELGSGRIQGSAPAVEELRIPYQGRELHGPALLEQLDRWVDGGSVEPSFAAAVGEVAENPHWLALAGRRVALVGAGAEIGPLGPLCAWGAEVVALDVPRAGVWERIARVASAGAATVHVPIAQDGAQGADLLCDLPEANAWLRRLGQDAELVLGMYAYLDGGGHVCVSAAFDAIATELIGEGHASALAYLATPTDAFVVPAEAAECARAAYAGRGLRRLMQTPVQMLSGGRLFKPAYADGVPVADALVTQQGPNYALAKRCQRWRGVDAQADGQRVSFNVAPATWTRSVTKNRVLAAAYAGAHRFGVEIFAPDTTRVLMAALLVHDLNRAPAAGGHPESLFAGAAAHGGLWRAAYEPGSVLGIAALAGLPSTLVGRSPVA
jgi:hypothetical protein